MQMIITDVTESAAGRIDVAGWNPEQSRMVRLHAVGKDWTVAMLREHKIASGQTVTFDGAVETEVQGMIEAEVPLAALRPQDGKVQNWFAPPAPPLHSTLKLAYGAPIGYNKSLRGLRQSIFVAGDAVANELCGIEIHSQLVRFIEESGKLKLVLQDDDDLYQLAVASLRLKAHARKSGLAALNAQFITPRMLHVRLGLAAPASDQNNKRFCQVNDIYG